MNTNTHDTLIESRVMEPVCEKCQGTKLKNSIEVFRLGGPSPEGGGGG